MDVLRQSTARPRSYARHCFKRDMPCNRPLDSKAGIRGLSTHGIAPGVACSGTLPGHSVSVSTAWLRANMLMQVLTTTPWRISWPAQHILFEQTKNNIAGFFALHDPVRSELNSGELETRVAPNSSPAARNTYRVTLSADIVAVSK